MCLHVDLEFLLFNTEYLNTGWDSLNLGKCIIKDSVFFKISITPDVPTENFCRANIPKNIRIRQ